jgi:anti-sigma factor RsiW
VTCRELAEFLMDYLDGALPAGERHRFEEHLGECPDCVAHLHSYRATVRLGRSLCDEVDDAPPTGMPEELVRAILAARCTIGSR